MYNHKGISFIKKQKNGEVILFMLEVVNMIEIQGRDVEMSSLCKEERKEIGMKLHIQAMSKLGYKPKVKNDKTA